jgi:hypothetical protein
VARRRFASVNETRNSTGMNWDYEDKCCFACVAQDFYDVQKTKTFHPLSQHSHALQIHSKQPNAAEELKNDSQSSG